MIYQFQNKQVFYSVEGEGTPLVLLHGFLESSTMWQGLTKDFADTHQVVSVDLPGHGKTETIENSHSMELMATMVHSLIESLNLNKVMLLGHSMGGYVALAFVELFPEKVSHLVLLNSTAAADSPERIVNRNRALELIKNEKRGFIAAAIPQLFCDKSRSRFAKDIEALIREAKEFPGEGIAANIRGMRDRKDRTHVLKAFDGPKILICGEEDPVIPLEHSKSLAIASDTPIEILSGSHMSWLENPPEIVKIVHFIEKNGT